MVKRRTFLKLGAAGMAVAGAGGLLGACNRDEAETLTVGSKSFQEQYILAALLAKLIERDTDAEATTKRFETTFACHDALKQGAIQSYVEYTGTAYAAVLGHYPEMDPDKVYQHVAREYADDKGILWLPRLGFQNKYAVIVRADTADKHGLSAISDIGKVQDELRPGFVFEFYDRADGYPGLIQQYELSFDKEPVSFGPEQDEAGMEEMYSALLGGDVDLVVGHSTDGFIDAHDLVMLDDDRDYFPPYDAAPLLRADTAEDHPKVKEVLTALGGKIDVAAMRRANRAVDLEGKTAEAAAEALLSEIGLG